MREYPYSHDTSSVKTCQTFVIIKRFRIFYEYFRGLMLVLENEVSAFVNEKCYFKNQHDEVHLLIQKQPLKLFPNTLDYES